MVTKRGFYRVFDVSDPSFLPGQLIPGDFVPMPTNGGTWFFMPSDWEGPDWGGSYFASLRKFPMAYSLGFGTADAALEAAQEWENDKERREASWAHNYAEVERIISEP